MVKKGPVDFLYVAGHLETSIGLVGPNLKTLEQWAAWLTSFAGPWMIAADFNCEP